MFLKNFGGFTLKTEYKYTNRQLSDYAKGCQSLMAFPELGDVKDDASDE